MSKSNGKPSRRQAMLVGAGLLGAGATAAALGRRASQTSGEEQMNDVAKSRMPVIFVPHGGGPWPFVELGMGAREEQDELRNYLAQLGASLPTPAKALLVISAHWEEPVFTVMNGAAPPMLYDYYGFPKESYAITWPAPGEPVLAARVEELVRAAGFDTASNAERGFDHGTFVPLKLAYPDADVPCVQLSLRRGLDPEEHLRLGRALQPLRDEGVLIVGSGMTFHNLRAFGPQSRAISESFDAWLRDTTTKPARERDAGLAAWQSAPEARRVHPREEHLLPLMVVAGAAGDDVATIPYNGTLLGLRLSAYHFG